MNISYCRLAIVLLLLVAGATKLSSLTVGHPQAWRALLVVGAEVLAGLMLLAPRWRRQSWLAALGLFATFAVFSLYRGLAGFASCGCFGPFEVHPWWTFGLDLAVIGLLVARRSDFIATPDRPIGELRPLAMLTAMVVVGGVSVTIMLRSAPTAVRDGMAASSDGSLMVLEPTEWIGKAFPLTNEISPDAEFATGEWIVVLYHHDCPKCQEALPRYERLAGSATDGRDRARVLLVETPPFGGGAEPAGRAARARLSADRQWFVQAPVEIQLRDGNVTLASLDLPSLAEAGRQ